MTIETTTPTAPVVPPVGGAPAPAPAAPAAAAPPPPAAPRDEVTMSSEALKKRLDEERGKARKTFLKEHGFEDEAAFQAFQKAAKEAADAKLSADERTAARLKELEPYEAEAKRLKARFTKDVEARFAKLTEEQQAAIDEEAGGDPEKRDAFMRILAVSAPPPPPAAPAKKAAAAPASTTTAPPTPPTGGAAPTAFETYQDLLKTDPSGASIYLQMNAMAISKSRPVA